MVETDTFESVLKQHNSYNDFSMSLYREIIMNKVKQIRLLLAHYKTRKQLAQLPAHLLRDIAITHEQRLLEVKKSSVVNLLVNLLFKRG